MGVPNVGGIPITAVVIAIAAVALIVMGVVLSKRNKS